MLTYEPAQTSAKSEPRNACHRDEAASGGEAIWLERIVDFAPGTSPFHPNRARLGVNLYAFHRRQVNH